MPEGLNFKNNTYNSNNNNTHNKNINIKNNFNLDNKISYDKQRNEIETFTKNIGIEILSEKFDFYFKYLILYFNYSLTATFNIDAFSVLINNNNNNNNNNNDNISSNSKNNLNNIIKKLNISATDINNKGLIINKIINKHTFLKEIVINELIIKNLINKFEEKNSTNFYNLISNSNEYTLDKEIINLFNYTSNILSLLEDNKRINVDNINHQSDNKFYISHESLIINNLKFLENELMLNLYNNCNNISKERKGANFNIEAIKYIEHNIKQKLLYTYVDKILSSIFSNDISINEDFHTINSLKIWVALYYIQRLGLEDELTNNNFNDESSVLYNYLPKESTQETEKLYKTIKSYRNIIIFYSNYNSNSNLNINDVIEDYKLLYLELINQYDVTEAPSNNNSAYIFFNYKTACLNLILKLNNDIGEEIQETISDYIWYNLKLTLNNQKTKELRNYLIECLNNNKLNLLELEYNKMCSNLNKLDNFLTLEDLQNKIVNSLHEIEESCNNEFEISKCLISIGLISKGISYLINNDYFSRLKINLANKKELYLVESMTIAYILNEVGLLYDFYAFDNKYLQDISGYSNINTNECDYDLVLKNNFIEQETELLNNNDSEDLKNIKMNFLSKVLIQGRLNYYNILDSFYSYYKHLKNKNIILYLVSNNCDYSIQLDEAFIKNIKIDSDHINKFILNYNYHDLIDRQNAKKYNCILPNTLSNNELNKFKDLYPNFVYNDKLISLISNEGNISLLNNLSLPIINYKIQFNHEKSNENNTSDVNIFLYNILPSADERMKLIIQIIETNFKSNIYVNNIFYNSNLSVIDKDFNNVQNLIGNYLIDFELFDVAKNNNLFNILLTLLINNLLVLTKSIEPIIFDTLNKKKYFEYLNNFINRCKISSLEENTRAMNNINSINNSKSKNNIDNNKFNILAYLNYKAILDNNQIIFNSVDKNNFKALNQIYLIYDIYNKINNSYNSYNRDVFLKALQLFEKDITFIPLANNYVNVDSNELNFYLNNFSDIIKAFIPDLINAFVRICAILKKT